MSKIDLDEMFLSDDLEDADFQLSIAALRYVAAFQEWDLMANSGEPEDLTATLEARRKDTASRREQLLQATATSIEAEDALNTYRAVVKRVN